MTIAAVARSKSRTGNFFEDFKRGQILEHATPRTITRGDVAFYTALYGSRFAVQSSDEFAKAIGYPQAPIDDLLVFHIVFGKTVPDISLNAIANLGYADGRFLTPVYPGDTLRTVSEICGLKHDSSGQTGTVYVKSTAYNQRDEVVLEYFRWVMVRRREPGVVDNSIKHVPSLESVVPIHALAQAVPMCNMKAYNNALAGSKYRWEHYHVGEQIDHIDGMTIEEAEHQTATRLYQNTAKVHFNQHTEAAGRFGKRIVYGGVVISIARALSFNGLGNAFHVTAINAGRHVAPCFAGDTIYAWSEILQKEPIRENLGALRIRLVATKDRPCHDFPYKNTEGKYEDGVVLDLDLSVVLPRL